jgi:hypothetical protein
MSWSERQAVVCSPQQLRLHPALDKFGWSGVIGEFNEATQLLSFFLTLLP